MRHDLDPDALVAAGRRGRRRRRTALLLSGTAAAAVPVLAWALLGGSGSPVVVTPAAEPAPTVPAQVTEDNLAQTVAEQLGITWRIATVHGRNDGRRPADGPTMTVFAAVADPAGDSALSLTSLGWADEQRGRARIVPSCASAGPWGHEALEPALDSYTGPCTERTLAKGSVVIARDTRSGAYARATALLVRPDGSSLMVESTNQAAPDPSLCTEDATGKHCPVPPITRTTTGVSATALSDLLVALEPATR